MAVAILAALGLGMVFSVSYEKPSRRSRSGLTSEANHEQLPISKQTCC